jgi:hypothetical protein
VWASVDKVHKVKKGTVKKVIRNSKDNRKGCLKRLKVDKGLVKGEGFLIT